MDRVCRWFSLSRRELGALAAVFVLSLPAVTPRLYSSDEVEYFSYLRSLWFDHDVSFENEYQHFYDLGVARAEGFHETFLERETDAGRRHNFGTVGCALLWAPFYALGDVAARVAHASDGVTAVDGFSKPYIAAVAYGSAFYGFVALLVSIGAARRLLRGHGERSETAALLAGIVVWIGTPLLFYMYVAPPMSHACSAFAVSLFVALWLHVRQTWTMGQVIALGVAAALMAMVREQDVFFAIVPAADYAISALKRTGVPFARSVAIAGAGCGAFAVAFLPQAIAYVRLNGHLGPSKLVARKMTWTAPHAPEVLASPSHGFLFWTPLAMLCLAGLVLLAARHTGARRQVAVGALIMVALQVYVGGSVESWNVAGAFGQRRFVAMTVLLVVGLAALWSSVPRVPVRVTTGALALLCVWWNVGLIALFGTGLMDRKQLEPARNAYDVFVTIPAHAPQLAYRYLFDRSSYYRAAPPRMVP